MTYEQVKTLKPTEFKRLCGVYPDTFKDMVTVLKAEKVWQKKTGRPSKLSTEDQLLITLEYWREYRTYFHRGNSWGVNESTAYRIVRKVENILIKSGLFNLPGKKALLESNSEIEIIVVDVSEQEIERPKKKQKSYYSGKQGYHTLKSQVVADQKSEQVICVRCEKGRVHDFRLWKESKIRLNKEIEILGDQGYQGIQKIHQNSQIPHKKKKKEKLSKEQKKANRQLSQRRIVIEHIHRRLKIFRILSSRYRNRRRRFGLRLNLIAGIYNYELRYRQKDIS
ncbi:MAG: IS5 family transposase [Microcystis viridis Mv_BB_P_19951000_S69]|uniref:IS5 family transposase n=1 Tax=Microcystis viridis Mv_BB_P_19951000_S68D TaxID=2486270 RepID=A0A552HD77_MICVR|nr:MAG: IS5 family transposase [Microcystis viridis Mv_BB_P_19951000_S68D]TRU78020.1 MAG: IS5 family transposase [Microcystis viridis Mv_BB_P_19951000_S68]TRU78816.1 MAG: IS5 family transposase [Microcystis viridis Mv_BB_P_19951000_S69]TRU90004.1 MAG: IS5 family transposase [Microcystis viridis Mv_BB_P_19951000_S69D]